MMNRGSEADPRFILASFGSPFLADQAEFLLNLPEVLADNLKYIPGKQTAEGGMRQVTWLFTGFIFSLLLGLSVVTRAQVLYDVQDLYAAGTEPYIINGKIYGSIREYSPNGQFKGVITTIEQTNVLGIAFDSSGILYASVHGLNDKSSIHKFSASGADLGLFVDIPVISWKIAFDSAGNLLAVGDDGNIRKYSPSGTLLSTFGNLGVRNSTRGIAIDADGYIYVCEIFVNRIHKFAPDGTDMGIFLKINQPFDIKIDRDGNLWVTNPSDNYVSKYSPSGTLLARIVGGGSGLAVDDRGNAYAANTRRSDILKVSSSGDAYGKFVIETGGSAFLTMGPHYLSTEFPDAPIPDPYAVPESGALTMAAGLGAPLALTMFRRRRRG